MDAVGILVVGYCLWQFASTVASDISEIRSLLTQSNNRGGRDRDSAFVER